MAEYKKEHAIVGIEPTGHYWLPLAEFLRKQGIPVVVVNPYMSREAKKYGDSFAQ
ncbi:MAG: IS110 family transposase [Firmicutes bacterium]|nr:IS110 family transposase [Bacillota bacterium]